MSTHTPGPWAVHAHSAFVVPAEHLNRQIGGSSDPAVDLATYAQEICALHWPDLHRTEAEVRANAQLIAAAPEVLAALKYARRMVNASECDIAYIDAAIAKAEGK